MHTSRRGRAASATPAPPSPSGASATVRAPDVSRLLEEDGDAVVRVVYQIGQVVRERVSKVVERHHLAHRLTAQHSALRAARRPRGMDVRRRRAP